MAEGLRRAGSDAAAKVAAALRAAPVPTAVGDIAFDAKGDNRSPGYRVYRWVGDRAEAISD